MNYFETIPYEKISFMISPPEMNLLCEVFVMECIERFIISSVCKRRHHFCVLQSLILFSSEGLQNFLPCLKKSTGKLYLTGGVTLVLHFLKGIRKHDKYKNLLPANLSSATVCSHGLAEKHAGRPIPENI